MNFKNIEERNLALEIFNLKDKIVAELKSGKLEVFRGALFSQVHPECKCAGGHIISMLGFKPNTKDNRMTLEKVMGVGLDRDSIPIREEFSLHNTSSINFLPPVAMLSVFTPKELYEMVQKVKKGESAELEQYERVDKLNQIIVEELENKYPQLQPTFDDLKKIRFALTRASRGILMVIEGLVTSEWNDVFEPYVIDMMHDNVGVIRIEALNDEYYLSLPEIGMFIEIFWTDNMKKHIENARLGAFL